VSTHRADRLDGHGRLLHPYALVAAEVDPFSGAVEKITRQVFRRGQALPRAAIDREASTSVQVMAHAATREPVYIAVVATPNGDLREASLVTLTTLPLPPLKPTRVTVYLDPSGDVSLSAEPPPQPTAATLESILSAVPDQVDVIGRASLDFVCVVDLAGQMEGFVEWRLHFARKLVEALSSVFPLPGALRTALVGCSDVVHVRAEELSARDLGPSVDVVPFGLPDAVLDEMHRFRSLTHPAQDFPIALEEALDRVQRIQDWRDGSSHVVVTIASRPPHPFRPGEHRLLPSPARIDWRTSVERLQHARPAASFSLNAHPIGRLRIDHSAPGCAPTSRNAGKQ
jgi:hypothetical protein